MGLKRYILCFNVFCVTVLLNGCYKDKYDFAESPKMQWKSDNSTVICKTKPEELNNKDCALKLMDNVELDIPMLLDIAFDNSPSTHRAWQMSKVAAAQRGQACSIFFPVVSVSGVISRSSVDEFGNDGKIQHANIRSSYPAIDIAISAFQFGAHVNTASAAKKALYAANFQYNRSLQTLAHDVQIAYLNLDSALSNVEAQSQNLLDAQCAFRTAELKFQSGLTNIQEFLQSKANLENAMFKLEKSKANVEISRANLSQVIGVHVSSKIKIYKSSEPQIDENFVQNIDELIDASLKSRPDILSAYSDLLSKQANVAAMHSKFCPEVVIGFHGDKKHIHGASDKIKNNNVFVKVQWEVFNGFRDTYNVLEAKALKEKSRQELRSIELAAAAEIWKSYYDFKSCIKQFDAAKLVLQTSQESFDAMKIGYDNGLAKFNDLLSTQHQLAQARTNYVLAKNNLSKSIIELSYATGDLISSSNLNNR